MFHVQAQEAISIYFPVGDAVLHRDMVSNVQAFASLDSLLAIHGEIFVDSVIVVSKASPEGGSESNGQLSLRRSESMRSYILDAYPELASRIRVRAEGEAWDELRVEVLTDDRLNEAQRMRLLNIIDSKLSKDAKEALLRTQPEYNHLLRDLFPQLRVSRIMVMFDRVVYEFQPVDIVLEEPDFTVPVETFAFNDAPLHVDLLSYAPEVLRNMIFALKTNLLYDAATALNFEVEVPVGSRYSIMAEDVFPWWETGNKYCLQLWAIGVEARVWFQPWETFGTDKLRGFFAGPYAMSGIYDFQYDTKFNYQGEAWSAGLSFGYALPLGRSRRNRMEFSLGLGYLSSQYRHYLPTDSYDMLIRDPYNVGVLSYIGPTKAKVSLVIPVIARKKKK